MRYGRSLRAGHQVCRNLEAEQTPNGVVPGALKNQTYRLTHGDTTRCHRTGLRSEATQSHDDNNRSDARKVRRDSASRNKVRDSKDVHLSGIAWRTSFEVPKGTRLGARHPARPRGEPNRRLDERLDDDFYTAALDCVTPGALHAAIDQQRRRNPALRPIEAPATLLRNVRAGLAKPEAVSNAEMGWPLHCRTSRNPRFCPGCANVRA